MPISTLLKSPYLLLLAYTCVVFSSLSLATEQTPNIVIIYADDMGYGDLAIQNAKSKIPTPNLDQLAKEGIRFTDAHSSSGICSPSRYALLTGKYHWRKQHDIVGSFGKPFFNDDDITLPQILKAQGYKTAAIGKWHLGFNWVFKNKPSGRLEKRGRTLRFYQAQDIDWTQPVSGGPLDRGFDYYFGDDTINFPPYAWMENDRFLNAPTTVIDGKNIDFPINEGNWEFRPGPAEENWNPYKVLPTLTQKAISWIKQQTVDQPFFLYFPLPAPHAPIIPNKEFIGKSQAGPYGDFVVQTDWVVGQVLQALKEQGLSENTLIIFTSDNGPEKYAFARAEKYQHYSMGEFRGLKRDVWEGGHHVPFLVKWPNKIAAGSVSDEVISQVDIMATLAEITHITLSKTAAPDSYNLLPLLSGKKYELPLRQATVHNTFKDTYALRQGKWLYINQPTGEHSVMPNAFANKNLFSKFTSATLLFDLEKDPGQRTNLQTQYPEKIKQMNMLLEQYRQQGYSVLR